MEGFYSTQAIIGLALIWWGLGAFTVAVAWGVEKSRQKKEADKLVQSITDLLDLDLSSIGHVIDYHGHGPKEDELMHAHCICGEHSLDYRQDDPTAERLMEQWADNHIESMMESADV